MCRGYHKTWLRMAVVFILVSSLVQVALTAEKELELNLQEKKIKEITADSLILSFLARVDNRSDKPCFISSYQYRVLINQKEYFTQNITLDKEKLEIRPGEPVLINFPVRLSYQYLNPFLTENQKQATCQVSGQMFFVGDKKKGEKIPFEWSMSFPIFKMPQLKFWPLPIKDLTLGGADFKFVFSLVNENAYEVLIQDINLELSLAGKVIFKGKLGGDKTLGAGEEKAFPLSLMLDFFEQGRELRDELEKEKPEFKLKAQMTADSAWGVLDFVLEKTDRVEKQFSR